MRRNDGPADGVMLVPAAAELGIAREISRPDGSS